MELTCFNESISPVGGGEIPYKNYRGALWKFWKKSLRGIDIMFCEGDLNYFSPLRDTNSKRTDYLLSLLTALLNSLITIKTAHWQVFLPRVNEWVHCWKFDFISLFNSLFFKWRVENSKQDLIHRSNFDWPNEQSAYTVVYACTIVQSKFEYWIKWFWIFCSSLKERTIEKSNEFKFLIMNSFIHPWQERLSCFDCKRY